jgi:energy-coupling factor transport system ATP-binding protein
VSDVPILETRELWHTYDQGPPALRGVDLVIGAGEFVAVVGSNGSGKTTLSKHFNGLLKPSRGTVLVAGTSTRAATVAQLARRVGFVFQNPDHQIFCASVEEEVLFALRLQRLPAEEAERRALDALRAVGLDGQRARHPRALSGGQRQRLATASVLALETDVVVLDEPTTGQDALARRQLMALAAGLHRAGRTIVMVTHDMALVTEYATRVVVLHAGNVICDAPPAQVFARDEIVAAADLQVPPVLELARAWRRYGVPATATTAAELCAALRAARSAGGREAPCP